jgi:hypothetical protein
MMGFVPPNGVSHPALGAYTTVFDDNHSRFSALPRFNLSSSGSGSATSSTQTHRIPSHLRLVPLHLILVR